MQFDTFIDQAWDDHVRDPRGVAGRLGDVLPLVADERQFIRLADITHHLYGDHLGDRPAGLAAIGALARHPVHREDGPSGAAVRRFVASLHLSQGDAGVLDAFGEVEQVRIVALAISNLTDADWPRAVALFHEVRRRVAACVPDASDEAHDDIALMAHNLAAGIEREANPSRDDLELMVLAAQTARHHWGLRGDAADVFPGEIRLASAWRKSGDVSNARRAAERCVRLAGDGAPLRRFLAWHALALVERDAANASACGDASRVALSAYAELGAAEQARHAAKRAQLSGA